MNIALIGYGKMGKMLAELAPLHEMNITSIIDPNTSSNALQLQSAIQFINAQKTPQFAEPKNSFQSIHLQNVSTSIQPQNTAKAANATITYPTLNAESLKNVDAAIDFSQGEVALEHIQICAENGVNLVMGTTGWYDKIDEAKKIVKSKNIGFLYASNFSIGVQLFFKIIERAANFMNTFDEYDIFAHEFHHRQKKDSPSGTALSLGQLLIKNIDRKTQIVTEKLDRNIAPEEIHISSTRGGYVPGTHAVYFDSEADAIEIKHTARSRKGFAIGALKAAKWLHGKKGFFTMEDWIKNIIAE